MTISAEMVAAASEPAYVGFTAVRMTLAAATICLLDGSGVVTFDGSTFVGEDPVYGSLAGVEEVTDGGEDEASRARIRLNPKDLTALTTLAGAGNQGSLVEIWEGFVDLSTGLAVETPDLAFEGFYDQPAWSFANMALEIDCGSVFELFFENEEGARLTDSFHQSICPGELGFQYVIETLRRKLPWSTADAPRPTSTVTAAPRSTKFDPRFLR